MSVVTKGAAMRIALASRVLEGVDPRDFMVKLAERLAQRAGLPIDEEKLGTVTVAEINLLLIGEGTVEDAVEPEQTMDSIKLAVRYLWGENDTNYDSSDVPEPEAPVDQANTLCVAVASNSAENLDGHFGSAMRFLIYQVDKTNIRLVHVRPTYHADRSEDKNAARAALISDCQLLYTQSIGGPSVAKVVRAGVHPIKVPNVAPAREVLTQLQSILDAPPPWLARALGMEAKSLARFAVAEEEA